MTVSRVANDQLTAHKPVMHNEKKALIMELINLLPRRQRIQMVSIINM